MGKSAGSALPGKSQIAQNFFAEMQLRKKRVSEILRPGPEWAVLRV
jgi:hypothetical protein